jgi:hypothetical protein
VSPSWSCNTNCGSTSCQNITLQKSLLIRPRNKCRSLSGKCFHNDGQILSLTGQYFCFPQFRVLTEKSGGLACQFTAGIAPKTYARNSITFVIKTSWLRYNMMAYGKQLLCLSTNVQILSKQQFVTCTIIITYWPRVRAMDLLHWPSDSEVNTGKTEVGYFPVLPEQLRSVSFLLYGIVRL